MPLSTMRLILLTGLLYAHIGVYGVPPKTLNWEDLKPAELSKTEHQVAQMQRSVFKLPRAERLALQAVQLEREAQYRTLAGEQLSDKERAAFSAKPSLKYPKAVAFWDKVSAANERYAALQNEVEPSLNEQRVRIPGYVLPLEFNGSAVTEFLLVPYVGACIHEPTPSANQMVHVQAKVPFESSGLFIPVWIEGKLETQSGSYNLNLVDGAAQISPAYQMRAAEVAPYHQ
jgi:hypothetical protein